MLNKLGKMSLKGIGMDKLAIIVACGIVLVICSFDSEKKQEKEVLLSEDATNNTNDYEKALENRLEKLLENIDGVGTVEVMLTVKNTKEKVVFTETPYSKSSLSETDAEGGQRTNLEESKEYNTVYTTDENGDTVPYVVNEIMPDIEGVAIIAKGGDSPTVKEKIIDVVKSLFNVEVNKISISKMK